jgi:iron(III) transport system permease protein
MSSGAALAPGRAAGTGVDGGERAVRLGLAAFVALVAFWPVARLLAEAVAPGGHPGLLVLAQTWAAPATRIALGHTLVASGLGTILATLLGAGLALVVALTDIRGKTAMVVTFMLLLMVAPQVLALAWAQLAGPGSPLLGALGLAPRPGSRNPLYSPGGVVLLFGLHHAPLVFLAVRPALRQVPRALLEAAQVSGAGAWRSLLTIVLPLAGPAIAAGAGLAFVSCIGNFGIPALLGIPAGYSVLVTLIYQRLSGFGPSVLPEVAAIALGLGLIAGLALALQGWLRGLMQVGGADAGPAATGWQLGRWRPAAEALIWALLLAALVLPLAALLAQSLVPAIGVRLSTTTATLANYAYVLGEDAAARRAFTNSFLLAGAAAGILLLLAVPLAVLGEWRRSRAIALLSLAAELPYALPGVVLAMAMILVFLRPLPLIGISLYSTPWIILLAYLARFLTLAWRPVTAGLAQVDRHLDEAAQGAGAGFLYRLRTVLYPLLAPAAGAGAILVFLTAFNELTVSALLWSSGSETVGVTIFSLDQGGESSAAAAVSVLSVLATLALIGLASLLARRLPPGVLPWRA